MDNPNQPTSPATPVPKTPQGPNTPSEPPQGEIQNPAQVKAKMNVKPGSKE